MSNRRFVDIYQKGVAGAAVDFYIYPTDSVERKALLDALKDFVL
ncbi:MAG: hypothetical protein WCI87_00905 [Euryarchaeota archaeon]